MPFMDSTESDEGFDIQKFFKNPSSSGFIKLESPHPSHGALFHSVPSPASYSNIPAYPFQSQGSIYNQYPMYNKEQGPPVPLPLHLSPLCQSSSQMSSSNALDSARLMALLTNHTISNSNEQAPSDSKACDALPKEAAVGLLSSVRPYHPTSYAAPMSARHSNKKTPKGRHIHGHHIAYDIDIRLTGGTQSELNGSIITKYFSDPQFLLGRQIAVNQNYICYALRPNRHIRILNVKTALRNLLRGHSERVTDMAFFAEDVHILASASSDGRVFVRRITEELSEFNKMQISEEILLAVQFNGEWKVAHPRICWHSHNENFLIVGINKYVIAIDILKVKETAAPSGFTADDPVPCDIDNPIEGVCARSGHGDEVTDVSSCRWPRMMSASASKDGTVRLWEGYSMVPFVTFTPYDGDPVSSISFFSPPGCADDIVLLTGGPLNREIKLWVSDNGEGRFPMTGPTKLKNVQTFELKSSLSVGVGEVFFNQVFVMPKAHIVLIANAKRNKLYVLHLDFGSSPASTCIDYLAEFSVTMPILSFSATADSNSDGNGNIQVYCVQTEAIQQYSVDLSLCIEKDKETPEMEAHTKLRSDYECPIPISGFTTTENPDIKTELALIPQEPSSSLGPGLKPKELPTNMSSVVVPSPKLGSFMFSPRDTPLNGETHKLPEVTLLKEVPEQNDTDVLVKALSPRREIQIISDLDWKNMSRIPTGSGSHTPSGAMHLITPSELMSMVAMTKGEFESESTVFPKGSGSFLKEVEKSHKQNDNVRNVEPEATVYEGDDEIDKDQARLELNSVPMSMDKTMANTVENSHLEQTTITGAHNIHNKVIEESLSSIHIVEDLNEKNKEASNKIDDSLPPVVAPQNRKKKNKNKADSSIPTGVTLPPPQVGCAVVTKNSAEQVSTNNMTSSTIAEQISGIQESLSQLVNMRKDFEKQMGAIMSVPVVKEVKRMESSLGQRMEKMLKSHIDGIMAHVQEDIAKREKLENNRAQHINSMVSNLLSKELPETFERSAKKELSSLEPSVAHLVAPSLEKAFSISINESFQKLGMDKYISQIEKTIGNKIEASVSRQLQAHFQTNGVRELQEGLRSSLESSVQPAFERACNEIFRQVDSAFHEGVNEHHMLVKQHVDASQKVLTSTLQEAASSASSIAMTLKGDLADGFRKLFATVESSLGSRGIPEKAMTLQRVEESLDPTKEIARLISERKLEEAFNKALSLTDVGVVSWLCDQVDPSTIFTTTPPPLSQGVLLALVQQLGCDLGRDTDKKLMWIKDAALALNPQDPGLAPHMRHFLEQLYANLHALANTNLTPDLANTTRLVIHVVHSLLSLCK